MIYQAEKHKYVDAFIGSANVLSLLLPLHVLVTWSGAILTSPNIKVNSVYSYNDIVNWFHEITYRNNDCTENMYM